MNLSLLPITPLTGVRHSTVVKGLSTDRSSFPVIVSFVTRMLRTHGATGYLDLQPPIGGIAAAHGGTERRKRDPP